MPSILLPIANWFKDMIQQIGYPGLFIAMFVEGVITPIPSEIIVPFAGYLAAEGHFNIVLVILVASLGAVLGSTGAYYIGYKVGRPFIRKYGKYFRLKEEHMKKAEDWFTKYGDVSILLGHAMPGTRSFISFPAGIGKMRLKNFMVFTFFGAMIWNTFLALLGYFLGEAVFDLAETFEYFDIAVITTVVVVFVVYLLWKRMKRKEKENQDA